jgi:hypothetical protein
MDDATLSAFIYPTAPVPLLSEDTRRQDYNNRIPFFYPNSKRTGITRLLLWQEYRKVNPQGYCYTQFCGLLSEFEKTSLPSSLCDSIA